MTDPELYLFKQLLESAKIQQACLHNLLWELAKDRYPNGWTPNSTEQENVDSWIKAAEEFAGALP
jgi:hypothetical protein